MRCTTLDSIALARKAGALHERREVASALPPGRMCARAQEINAGERLPNCARMIVEEIQTWGGMAHADPGQNEKSK
jgi:hypothetical protein